MPIGTKVRLASGGPEMVVVDIDISTMRVCCAWRSSIDASESDCWFPIVCLDVIRRHWVI